MAAICGLSMAGLFTLLGELGCQHRTLFAPNTTVGNDKPALLLSLPLTPQSWLYFTFHLSKNTSGIFNYRISHTVNCAMLNDYRKEIHTQRFFNFKLKMIPFSFYGKAAQTVKNVKNSIF